MSRADRTLLERFFAKHGERVRIEGNHPLIVTDESSVWYIQEGHIDLFAVTLRDDEIVSRREFLFSLDPGRLIFGYYRDGTAGSDAAGHLSAGVTGTVLLRADSSLLYQEYTDSAMQAALSLQVQAWVQSWSKVLKLTEAIRPFDRLDEQLSDFHKTVHYRYLQRRVTTWQAEQQSLERKRSNDQAVMEQALKQLAAVTGSSHRQAGADIASNDMLYTACKLVGESIGMKVKPTNARQLSKIRDPVASIARNSGFRSRQVVLKDRWWLEDNGSLLGYIDNQNIPVALIQKTPKAYAMIDPETGDERTVTEQIAKTLATMAHMFYRPLPATPLKVADILKFGLHTSIRRDIGMMLLMGVAVGILGTFVPIANGILFDTIIPASDRGMLLQMGFILASVTLSLFLLELTQSMAILRLEGKMDSSIQAAVWDRLLSLPVSFFRGYPAGDLSMRANSINAIRQSLSGIAMTAIFGGIFSSFNFFLLFYYDVKMALAAAAMVFMAFAVTIGVGILQVRRQRVLLRIEGKLTGTLFQIINGIAKFRMAAAEKRAFFIWAKLFGEMKETDFRARTLTNLHAVFHIFFPSVTAIVLFYMFASGSSALSPGKFIAFFAAFSAFLGAMLSMSSAVVSSLNIVPLYERAKPILQTIPEVLESRDDPGELTGEIEAKHIHFRYQADQPFILNDLSLHIHPGEFVALVGASGCGKSTLFRLLLGFENPESGSIFLNGQDLTTLDIRAVRSQLGVVLQNGKVMSGDLFTNIVGSSNLTIEDAWEAATMAGLDEDIRQMPMGMHTMVSEGGSTLSGGQRQRMMIARAIAGKPKILLFDEATSALDNRTQTIVSQSLEALKVTRIVIAHRLSTIRNADRILVIDKGNVVQAGTYEELMRQEGLFGELAKRQLA